MPGIGTRGAGNLRAVYLFLHRAGSAQPVGQRDVAIVGVVAGLRNHLGDAHGHSHGGDGGDLSWSRLRVRGQCVRR